MPARKPEPGNRPPLTLQQRKILQEISDLVEVDLVPYHGRQWEALDQGERDHLVRRLQAYDRAILKAAKAGLGGHPLVAPRIAAMGALGGRDVLRSRRIGLEKGLKRSISQKHLELWDAISRRREQGQPWERIRRALIREGRIKDMSRQGFHQLLGRLNLLGATQEAFGDPPPPVQPLNSVSDAPAVGMIEQVRADQERQRRRHLVARLLGALRALADQRR